MNERSETEVERLDRIQRDLAEEYTREISDLRAALTDAAHGDDTAMREYWAVAQTLPDGRRDEQMALLRDFLEGYEKYAALDGLHPDPVSSLQPPAVTAAQDQSRAHSVQGDLDVERESRGEISFDDGGYDDYDDDQSGADEVAWEVLAQARRAVEGARASSWGAIPGDSGTGFGTDGGLHRHRPIGLQDNRDDQRGDDQRGDGSWDDGGDDGSGWQR